MSFPALLPVYKRSEIAPTHGEGAWLYAEDGKRYLDFVAGIAVDSLGHCHPHVVKALQEQAGKLWHVSNGYTIRGQETLAQRLVDATFADTVFFCNSGAEAWECGLKMVRRYFTQNGQPQKWRVITAENCFHGRTFASISAAKKPSLTAGFGRLMDGFDQVPFNDLAAMRAAITPETAALHVETIQGEGGVTPATAEYLRGLRDLCDAFGLLLFLDEIQCGMGRTGKLLAHEHYGIKPDIVCIAKALGNGFPIGACLATEAVGAVMSVGSHGTTFGGNPLAMAVGHAVLDVMLEDGFMAQVSRTGEILRRALLDLATEMPENIGAVRGMGLMLGVELKSPLENVSVIQALRRNGLLTAQAGGNVIRILPPLVIDETQIALAVEILAKTLRAEAEKLQVAA